MSRPAKGGRGDLELQRLGRLALGVFGLLAFAYLTVPAVDPDYGWHVANGRHLLDGVLLRGADVYSWTARGARWIAHEWLSEGVMAFLHDGPGPTANSLLAGAMATGAVLLVVARLRLRGVGTAVALAAATLALLDAGTLASVGPAAVELLGLAVVLWLVDAWWTRAIGGRRLLVGVLVTELLWANAHGSFVVGLGVLGAAWLGLVSRRDRRARSMLALTVVAGAATLVNPFGIGLWRFVLEIQTGARLSLITEWQPPVLAAPMWWPFAVGLILAAAGTARWLARPRAAANRLDDVLVAVALAVAGLVHARHAGLLGIGAAPLIASGIASIGGLGAIATAVSRSPGPAPDRPDGPADAPRPVPRVAVPLEAAVLLAVAVGVAAITALRVGPTATRAAVAADYPVAVLPALDRVAATDGHTLRLFNDYAWGGWLEMTRPAIPVFIDGRSEVYGDAQVARYAVIAGAEPCWDADLAAVGVNAALIRAGGPLDDALRGRGWIVAGAGGIGVLLVPPVTGPSLGVGLGPSCP